MLDYYIGLPHAAMHQLKLLTKTDSNKAMQIWRGIPEFASPTVFVLLV
jgi:hypothetical protein